MGRVDIVNAMVKETGFKKDDCEKTIKSFITNIAYALKEGDKITLNNFGIFQLRDHDRIKGRNPKTGEEVTIPPFKVVKFKASHHLKETVNS